jgi:N-acetylglucosaminyl-diphospho-decaprenol L-rhamnosyltransferase
MRTGAPRATVVTVAYRTAAIDLGWVPAGTPVVVVHNDDRLDPAGVPGAVHLHGHGNVGFGAGINLALPHVATERAVLVNPDTRLAPVHWAPLAEATLDDVVVVPLVEEDGRPTSVVNRHPTPFVHVLGGLRAGRLAPRGGTVRRVLAPLLGSWGRDHAASLAPTSWAESVTTHWASAAVVSIATTRLRAVGGFDEDFFLYHEDADLGRRLADRFPAMRVVVADVPPGVHRTGGSGAGVDGAVAAYRRAGAARYASRQTGFRWRLVERVLSA